MRAHSSTNDTTKPQTGAETARVEGNYESLDVQGTKQAFDELNGVLNKLANTVVLTLDQIVPDLAKMQALLSQRGAERKKVLRGAGVPSWTSYAKAYANKVERSLRSFQQRIKQYREQQASGTSSPSAKAKGSNNGKPVRLDARQQTALVKAQLATNDLVAALKSGGDWQTPLKEYEKVAVSLAKLESFMNVFSLEPDWKGILKKFVDTLEHCGELPIPAVVALRDVRKQLDSQPSQDGGKTPAPAMTSECLPIKGPPKECKHESVDAIGVQGSTTAAKEWESTPPKKPVGDRMPNTPSQGECRRRKKQAQLARQASAPAAPGPPPDPGAKPAIGEEGSDPAEAICDEPCPFSPGDWITFNPTGEYLARFEGKEGNLFIVTRFNKVSKQWSAERTYATLIDRRLTTDEVRKRFPGALEAWPAERPENKTPKPTSCSSSKTVSGNATQPPTDVPAGQVPE
jgi:hypothetical protein